MVSSDKLVIDSLNTDRGVELVVNYIKSNGIEVRVERIPDSIVIRGRSYSSRDGINYVATDGSWTDLVVISTNGVLVKPIFKWRRRKSIDTWAVDYNKNWRDESIGGMLSDMSKNSINIGVGNMRPYNTNSQSDYFRESDRLMNILREKQVYIKDGDIQNELCEYIGKIPAIIRDNKIDQILG